MGIGWTLAGLPKKSQVQPIVENQKRFSANQRALVAIRDLQADRERDQHTYSVVPYRGKYGEGRRPLYVECAGPGLVFHPDKLKLARAWRHDRKADARALKAELIRRGLVQ